MARSAIAWVHQLGYINLGYIGGLALAATCRRPLPICRRCSRIRDRCPMIVDDVLMTPGFASGRRASLERGEIPRHRGREHLLAAVRDHPVEIMAVDGV